MSINFCLPFYGHFVLLSTVGRYLGTVPTYFSAVPKITYISFVSDSDKAYSCHLYFVVQVGTRQVGTGTYLLVSTYWYLRFLPTYCTYVRYWYLPMYLHCHWRVVSSVLPTGARKCKPMRIRICKGARYLPLSNIGTGTSTMQYHIHHISHSLVVGGGFVAFRAAVYDGQYLATWSPLAKDDASFPQHLRRYGTYL